MTELEDAVKDFQVNVHAWITVHGNADQKARLARYYELDEKDENGTLTDEEESEFFAWFSGVVDVIEEMHGGPERAAKDDERRAAVEKDDEGRIRSRRAVERHVDLDRRIVNQGKPLWAGVFATLAAWDRGFHDWEHVIIEHFVDRYMSEQTKRGRCSVNETHALLDWKCESLQWGGPNWWLNVLLDFAYGRVPGKKRGWFGWKGYPKRDLQWRDEDEREWRRLYKELYPVAYRGGNPEQETDE